MRSMFQLDHYAISVGDADRSIAFYQKLEFEVVRDWSAPDGSVRIVHMEQGGVLLELFCYREHENTPEFVEELAGDLQVNGSKHMGLGAGSLKEAAEYLVKAGVVEKKPEIVKGRLGRDYFFIKDPDGIFVEIIESRG